MTAKLVATFPTISEPTAGRTRKPAPTTVDEYVAMASPRVREALIAARNDIPGTAAGLARYERRKGRAEYPTGGKDKQGRWYPSDAEDADGYTRHLRSPSAAWPWSYLKGAFTLDHCLALENGSRACVPLLRKAVRGRSLAEVLAVDPAGRPAVLAALDRAILRQSAGLAATGESEEPAKRRVM
ncbi:MAG: hypothetical protein KGI42_03355 [Xanthomonadaceae bacterium]|nr:hypothetical protein [Xanthomonadaceae bacterium]